MALCSTCGAECPVEPLCDACAAQVRKQAGTASIAGFTLLRQMGTGRFGASYLGYTAEGVTAVKVLHAKPSSPEVAQRFLAGAANASGVIGPTVARLLTAGQLADGRLYLVHEYGGDQSLADVLRSHGRLSPPHALDVCAEVAEALAAAHERGVNHRDLKAANVGLWLDEDGSELVRVLDLTTWHVFKRSGLHESAPVPLSSAATASPEEARGDKVDARADLYALGVILYQCLTGRLPITGMTVAELLKSHREHPPLSLRDAGRQLPELEGLVAALLAKWPGQRPSSALEVAAQLRELAPAVESEQAPRTARAPGPPAETPLPAEAPVLVAPAPAAPPPPPAAAAAPRGQDAPSFDADRTPPDPVLASLQELPRAPEWMQQEAQRPVPPPPAPPPAPAKLTLSPEVMPPKPGGPPRAQRPLQPTMMGAPPPSIPPRVLRRKRGANAAFSGPGEHKRPALLRQLVKYGMGLVVLLALLVFGAIRAMQDPETVKRKRPAAEGRDSQREARKAARGADAEGSDE